MTEITNSGVRPTFVSHIPFAGAKQNAPTLGSGGGGYSRPSIDAQATGKPLQERSPAYPSLLSGVNSMNGASRHIDHQNYYGGMSQVGNPYVSSDDHLLATALKNNFSELEQFQTKKKGLSQAALKKIASEDPTKSTVSELTIKLAKEILNRPRLNEAILTNGGHITTDSLSKAAGLMVGNTNPNTRSADPFHAKTDRQVVETFRGMFDELRDKSEDWNFFFQKHRYVKVDKLIEMSKDPDEIGKNGEVVRDPATGFPKKKYSELQVYMAKNLVERPGLLASLDSNKANGTNIFGSHNDDGWLKNYSIDRWLKNDKKEKGS
ncbi:hypothetical protein [Pseudomonas sp. MWU15-20650]|uniref:hypothetical protein n=1 Tax=Pseudomonas sp. MWU15-20650 TaxID=2933107 RepID=UPI00200D42EA|nr:hypothetical protein [Pseudomonas sp. MWU15-20650]